MDFKESFLKDAKRKNKEIEINNYYSIYYTINLSRERIMDHSDKYC